MARMVPDNAELADILKILLILSNDIECFLREQRKERDKRDERFPADLG